MTEENFDIKSLISKLRQAFGSGSEVEEPNLKWNLLKKISSEFVNRINDNYTEDIIENYCAVICVLIDALSPTLFDKKWQEQLLESVFLSGIHHDTFIILVQRYTNSSPSYEQDKILDLLEKFLQSDSVQSMLLYQCTNKFCWNLQYIAASSFWDKLITLIISLPERVANKTKGNPKKIFTTTCYVPLIVSSIWKVLESVQQCLIKNSDCNLDFLGKLVGRLCTTGHVCFVVNKLAANFIRASTSDFICRRISQNFVCKIPASSMEEFIAQLLLSIPWYGYVEWILGDTAVSNHVIQFLMTVKFVLIRQFNKDIVVQNIIGYLAVSSTRLPLFYKVLESLVQAWVNESALRHQTFSQQYWLASSLMICAGYLKQMQVEFKIKALIEKVLYGAQIRIGSPESKIRSLGMIVGENLTLALDPGAPKLEFEHENTLELNNLLKLMTIPPKPENCIIDEGFSDNMLLQLNETVEGSCTGTISEEDNAAESLDSDDDLEPYDMSNDIPQEEMRSPVYLRDCLDGLIGSDKPEWTEKCLKSAESLIRGNPDNLQEVAVEMTKVLLHLEDNFAMAEFIGFRHRALIALLVYNPVQVAQYLTAQFYERDYNIRQRLDILEVLAASSQEMSQIKTQLISSEPKCSSSEFSRETNQHWKDVVEKRIEAKTIRYSQGPTRSIPKPKMNMFGACASYFFFPLVANFGRNNTMLKLFTDDSYVLGRLLYTLGIIMYSTSNAPVSRKIGLSFLRFLNTVREHQETFVRQSVIFAISTVFMTVPPYLLLTELHEEVMESQTWLRTVVDKDPDTQCQIKAARTLALLMKLIEEELPLLTETLDSR